MDLVPQIRYLTGDTGNDNQDDWNGSAGYDAFKPLLSNAIIDLVPPSNFFAAGDVTAGPTSVQEGDVFLLPDSIASKLERVTGTRSSWPLILILAAFIVCGFTLHFCRKK